jgi:amidohydrolase
MRIQFDDRMLEDFRDIRSLAAEFQEELVAIRRDLHAHPEQRFQEVRTASVVSDNLKKNGIEHRTGVGKTGVVGLLHGGLGEGKVIGIRCDMDALPIFEKGTAPYRSKNEGSMHACGHDVHISVGLGIAKVLTRMKNRFKGTVKFIFQPSEENPCGEKCGALSMIEDGVLENPPMDAIMSLHCWPDLNAGQVGVAPGPAMAGAEAFQIKIIGRQSHAASPQKGRDAILGAAEVVSSLHHIIPRRTDPSEPIALNVSFIEGGSKLGIVPGQATMQGSVRALSKETMAFMMDRIRDAVNGVSQILDLKNEVFLDDLYPPVINDKNLDELVTEAASSVIGKENVIFQSKCPMTAEDFSIFSDRIPAYYLKIGVANDEKGIRFPLHNDSFDVDERSIEIGVSVMAASALAFLNE